MGNTFWLSLSSVELLSKQKNDSKELDQTKSLLINDIDRKWNKTSLNLNTMYLSSGSQPGGRPGAGATGMSQQGRSSAISVFSLFVPQWSIFFFFLPLVNFAQLLSLQKKFGNF